MTDFTRQYKALRERAAYVDLSGRTLLEVTGGDRTTFLHNMCTNDIRALRQGEGCETFLTNVQGKILGFVDVYCAPESLVLDTVPDQSEKLLAHLDRYIIREQVELKDRTAEWGELLLAGAQAADVLGKLSGELPPDSPLAHRPIALDGLDVYICRVPWVGEHGFVLRGPAASVEQLQEKLTSVGATRVGNEPFESARIEAGTPLYGRDISDANLPQEVGRDDLAISFTSGCYLGQETVARIDALGHVNKMLCGLQFSADQPPEPGTALVAGEKQVGQVTSAAYSPRLRTPLALAYLRRGHYEPGTHLQSTAGDAEVVKLPVEG